MSYRCWADHQDPAKTDVEETDLAGSEDN